jgi:SAM-dependent methyltransferase
VNKIDVLNFLSHGIAKTDVPRPAFATPDDDEPRSVGDPLKSFAVNLTGNPGFGQVLSQARGEKVEVTLQQAAAAALPLGDASADTVVSVLVLCSVPDQAAALAEADRVLRPGGKLLLVEHVRAGDPAVARRQDRREGFHVRFAGGCHPNRDTLRAIAAAGFDTAAVRQVTLPGTRLTRPGIEGVARKPG